MDGLGFDADRVAIPVPQKIIYEKDVFTKEQEDRVRAIVCEEILRVPSELALGPNPFFKSDTESGGGHGV